MTDRTKQEEVRPLCEGAWSIPPSPLMLEHGNDYNTCSVGGGKADAPFEDKRGAAIMTHPTNTVSIDDIAHILWNADTEHDAKKILNAQITQLVSEILGPDDDIGDLYAQYANKILSNQRKRAIERGIVCE